MPCGLVCLALLLTPLAASSDSCTTEGPDEAALLQTGKSRSAKDDNQDSTLLSEEIQNQGRAPSAHSGTAACTAAGHMCSSSTECCDGECMYAAGAIFVCAS